MAVPDIAPSSSRSSYSPKSTPRSSVDKRVHSKTDTHVVLGNEVNMERPLSVDNSLNFGRGRGNGVGKSTPPSSERKRVTSRTEPHALLGNEVPVEHSRSVGGTVGGGRGRGSAQSGSPLLGNEVTPPGNKLLRNEVTASRHGSSRDTRQQRRETAALLGNEVSMPGFQGTKRQGVQSLSPRPPTMSVASLGNEVPLPRATQVTNFAVVENVQQSLPVGVGGSGRASGLLGNEVEVDSGYTTAVTLSDTASTSSSSSVRRKPLKSDSSSDSLSSRSTVEPARLTTAPSLQGHTTTLPTYSSPNLERQSSSDNDLSSGEDEEKLSSSPRPSNQPPNQLSTPVGQTSTHLPSDIVQQSPQASYSSSEVQTPLSSHVSMRAEAGWPASVPTPGGASKAQSTEGAGGGRTVSGSVVDDEKNNLDEDEEGDKHYASLFVQLLVYTMYYICTGILGIHEYNMLYMVYTYTCICMWIYNVHPT